MKVIDVVVVGYSVTRKPTETLGSLYQAANANCESFAFTLFCFFDRVERLSVLWVQRLHFALNPNGFYIAGLSSQILHRLSNLRPAHHKNTVCSYGGPGGAPPPASSQLFFFLHTVLTCIIYLLLAVVNHQDRILDSK